MMFIPGWLISILTFPGVIVHEIAHQLFCRIYRVAVFDVCYFRFGNPAGYVIHEVPRSSFQHIMIGIGPFIINSVVGGLIAMFGVIPALQFESGGLFDYLMIWLGVSIAMHAFPSTGDAKSIWNALWSDKSSAATKLVGTPIVGLIYLGAAGSFFWLDLIYGVAVAYFIPNMIISIMA
ncbi:MAG: metalloprotease family protein [Armatimonadota bacterium]